MQGVVGSCWRVLGGRAPLSSSSKEGWWEELQEGLDARVVRVEEVVASC